MFDDVFEGSNRKGRAFVVRNKWRHPEAGEARRGTSQALHRFREMQKGAYVTATSGRYLRDAICN
jgi:hypothetical protein